MTTKSGFHESFVDHLGPKFGIRDPGSQTHKPRSGTRRGSRNEVPDTGKPGGFDTR